MTVMTHRLRGRTSKLRCVHATHNSRPLTPRLHDAIQIWQRFVDYSCTEASRDQALPQKDQRAYERTCNKHGLAVMRTDSTRLHVGGAFAPTRGVSVPARDFAQYSRSEHRYGVAHRPRGFDTVIRWFGYDLQNGLNASARREVIDIRQNNSWCDSETLCSKSKPRCCTCVGGARLVSHTRRGWQADGGRCKCNEHYRSPAHTLGRYQYDGFLNCGRRAPPRLELLQGATLGGTSPFHPKANLDIAVESMCSGKLRRRSVANLKALGGVRGDFEQARRASGCAWFRFRWPPPRARTKHVVAPIDLALRSSNRPVAANVPNDSNTST